MSITSATVIALVGALVIVVSLLAMVTGQQDRRNLAERRKAWSNRGGGPICPVCRKQNGYAPIYDTRRCASHR